jgi:alpha-mannosidase
MSVSDRNIIIETVKPAERGDGWIARLYESAGASTDVTVHLPAGTREVQSVNLVEREPRPLGMTNASVQLRFGPFEIQTLLIR